MSPTRNDFGSHPVRLNGNEDKLAVNSRLHEMVVRLSHAAQLRPMGDIVGNYCRKAFDSPAGMIFVEQDGDLQIVSQWRTAQIPRKQLIEDMIKRGPAARAFRTGESILWRQNRLAQSKMSRFLHRWLRGCSYRNVAFFPIRAEAQEPVGVLAIVLPDFTKSRPRVHEELIRLGHIMSGCIARARAYDKALAARIEAEKAIHGKDEFLSVLSHELRNPMMPILGWAVALSSGTLPEDKQNLALEGIVRNVRTLNYMIEDLFDAARIASGKLHLQLSETRIQDVVRDALTAVQPALENKKLRMSTDISEAIPPFLADSRRLQQVLMNLLNNAAKFTPGGGSIALQVCRRGESVECTVSDTGKGIEREFLPFVFDRFRQENRSTKVYTSGIGLGLAIAREIVELHGGSIEAFSEGTDKGSKFVLRLAMRRRKRGNRLHPEVTAVDHPAVGKKISEHRE